MTAALYLMGSPARTRSLVLWNAVAVLSSCALTLGVCWWRRGQWGQVTKSALRPLVVTVLWLIVIEPLSLAANENWAVVVIDEHQLWSCHLTLVHQWSCRLYSVCTIVVRSLWPTAIDKRSNQSSNWHSLRKVWFGEGEEKWAVHQSIDCTIWMQISDDISIWVNQLPGRCLHTHRNCCLWASNTYVMTGEKPEKGTTTTREVERLCSLRSALVNGRANFWLINQSRCIKAH